MTNWRTNERMYERMDGQSDYRTDSLTNWQTHERLTNVPMFLFRAAETHGLTLALALTLTLALDSGPCWMPGSKWQQNECHSLRCTERNWETKALSIIRAISYSKFAIYKRKSTIFNGNYINFLGTNVFNDRYNGEINKNKL